MNQTIAIIGAGYVGFQLAILFAKAEFDVIAYDNDSQRIDELSKIAGKKIQFTDDPSKIANANIYIAAIPTPLNPYFVPDLGGVTFLL